MALDDVADPQTQGLLVETELLFKDEGMVIVYWGVQDSADDIKDEEEEDGVCDLQQDQSVFVRSIITSKLRKEGPTYLSIKPRRQISSHQGPRETPQLRQNIIDDESNILKLSIESLDVSKIRLRTAISLRFVKVLLRDHSLQLLGNLILSEVLVLTRGQVGFEQVLSNRKAKDKSLPWKTRSVNEPSEVL